MKAIIFSALSLFIGLISYGQAGTIDTTFNELLIEKFGAGGGLGNYYNGSPTKLLSDNKLMVGGSPMLYNGKPVRGVMKLHLDGSIDSTFTSYFDINPEIRVNAILEQPDGKIILAGNFNSYDGINRIDLVRIYPDGTIDPTFQVGLGPDNPDDNAEILDLAITSTGKIIVLGTFTTFNGVTRKSIVRLEANGSVDLTFGSTNGSIGVRCMVVQSDEKIILGGNFSQYLNNGSFGIARLNPNGNLDPTFNSGNGILGSQQRVMSLALQPDGQILVGGKFNGYYNNSNYQHIVRINPNGSIDPTFQFTNLDSNNDDFVAGIAVQPSGKIITIGNFENINQPSMSYQHYRLNTDGSVDSTYKFDAAIQPNGASSVKTVNALPDGSVIYGGTFSTYDNYRIGGIVKVKDDGKIDHDFSPAPGVNNWINTIVPLPNGKKLIGGGFTQYNGVRKMGLAQLNADGTLDTTFYNFEYPFWGVYAEPVVYAIAVQPDGKILVGGNFNTFHGVPVNNLVRLNPDGSIDQSFYIGSAYGTNGAVYSIAIQSNGQIVIGGDFSTINGVSRNKIGRISADGLSVDNSFNNNYFGNNPVKSIKIVGNKIYFIREFALKCVLISTGAETGSIPLSDYPQDYAILSNGKILITGSFPGPKRYNNDLSLDPSWTNPNYESSIIRIDINGKIILANDQSGVFRLNADGTLDNSFSGDPLFDGVINDIQLEDNRLIAVGNFSEYLGEFHNSIVALGTTTPAPPPFQIHFDSVVNLSCTSDGNIAVSGLFGVPPYAYEWQNGINSTDSMIVVNTPGIYSCMVSDSQNDSVISSVLINGPSTQIGHDLNSTTITSSFRPGFDANVWVDAFNDGCVPVSGQLKLVYDPLLTFNSSNSSPDAQSGDTLIWNFTNLTYDSPHLMPALHFTTSQSAVIGDTIDFTTILTPIVGDVDTTNNVKFFQSPVINGYDPNIKSAYPIGKCESHYINQDQLLTYTVQFQNTGNSEAINIAVVDSLSSYLDLQSVRVIGSSHPMWTEVLPGNVLIFHFYNINLPDSTSNEPESHGYLIYEVNTLDSWINHNTEIRNNADIYFDFNPPIRTNTVTHTVYHGSVPLEDYNCQGAGLASNNESFQLLVYPNPTNESVTLELEDKSKTYEVILSDMQGRQLSQHTIMNGQLVISTEALPDGMYVITVIDENNSQFISNRRINKITR